MKMPTTTLNNPMVPLTMSIPGGCLQAGSIVVVRGEPSPFPNKFNVSLLCGPQPDRANVALQLAVQFDTQWVTRNTRINKEWGEEEGAMPRKFPFSSRKQFVIELFASNSAFFVAVDGHHFCEYHHRVPFTSVDTLQVQGSVRLTRVDITIGKIYPSFPPGSSASASTLDTRNPVLPFAALLGDTLAVGDEVQVYGQVKPFPNRFHVNLQQGIHVHPHAVIPFHFNPRFDGGERIIVLNSWITSWGNEERTASSPLKPGANFILIIKRLDQFYEITVNGLHVANYAHRTSADVVDAIAIDGDVIINRVAVI